MNFIRGENQFSKDHKESFISMIVKPLSITTESDDLVLFAFFVLTHEKKQRQIIVENKAKRLSIKRYFYNANLKTHLERY